MARELKHVKVGDELTCSHFNTIIDELNRWRRTKGAGLVDVDGADGTSPPTIVGHAAGGPIPAKTKSGGITAGSQSTPTTNSVTLLVSSGIGDGLAAGADVDCLNYSGRTITGAGKLIWLERPFGRYVVPLGDC